MSRIVLIICLAVAVAIAGVTTFYLLSRPDLSHPISASDIIVIDEDRAFRAGDPIFGYSAPLESYIPVFDFERNDESSIFDWGARSNPARYGLLLHDEDGDLRGSIFMVRDSEYSFSATSSFYLGGDFFRHYQEAVVLIKEYCAAADVEICSFRSMVINDGEVILILADTSDGVMGVAYEMISFGAILWPFTRNFVPEYDFGPTLFAVTKEQELRDLFILVDESR